MNTDYNTRWDDYYKYLEGLRKDGVNMYGATPFLEQHFGLEKRTARTILSSWMINYDMLKAKGVI
tara:strand:+ start:177 stop:371 length:195 start_codon:yes stop_codon:yes gene_type:complete